MNSHERHVNAARRRHPGHHVGGGNVVIGAKGSPAGASTTPPSPGAITIVSASFTYASADSNGVRAIVPSVIYAPPSDLSSFAGVHALAQAWDHTSTAPTAVLDSCVLDEHALRANPEGDRRR